ncbi:hypothetical protein OL548_15505 [Lysinibacillus sp. MHQ-1]|nr:hypothetical protein OL548_15505 [Lysinibacillus sp. MHQ-1]
MALSAVITVYSVICLLLGFMIMMLYKDPDQGTISREDRDGSKSFDWAVLWKVLKMPTTWLATILIFYVLCDDY